MFDVVKGGTAIKMTDLENTLGISSVYVNKSTGNCGFGHIYWRNPLWKTSFFVQRGVRTESFLVNIRSATITKKNKISQIISNSMRWSPPQ